MLARRFAPPLFFGAILLLGACEPSGVGTGTPPEDGGSGSGDSGAARDAARDDAGSTVSDGAAGDASVSGDAAAMGDGSASDAASPEGCSVIAADMECGSEDYMTECSLGRCFAEGCCCPTARQCRAGSFPVCCPEGESCMDTATGECG